MDVESLVNPHLRAMQPYTPIVPFEVLSRRLGRTPEEIVKLDANENPFGPSPRTLEAIAHAQTLHIYPDPDQTLLRQAISDYIEVPKEHILCGAGGDEVIDLIGRAFIQPGDAIIDLPPTFGMYRWEADVANAKYVPVSRGADFSIDVEAVANAVRNKPRAKLLFITNPNNPDGSTICDEQLRALLDLPLVVALDEAYIDFSSQPSRVKWVMERGNLIVLRTFSKLAGMAGLRVGYGVFPLNVIKHLWKIKQPYTPNVAGSIGAIAALSDREYLRDNVLRLVAERERMSELLSELHWLYVFPSETNFMLCRVDQNPKGLGDPSGVPAAKQLKLALEQRGILVRYFDKDGLRDCIRISVGKPEHTDKLIEALREIEQTTDDRRPTTDDRRPTTGDRRPIPMSRTSEIHRVTRETDVLVNLDLDGSGVVDINTGVGFYDHMLHHVAHHGLFDLTIKATGDLHIDEHHTVEDVAIALGQALDKALGDRAGIVRMADSFVTMDEALVHVIVDLSGRPYCVFDGAFTTPGIGGLSTSLIPHVFESLVVHGRMNLHARVLYGRDDHHKAEALFKALGRALDAATMIDPRHSGVPSTKGVL